MPNTEENDPNLEERIVTCHTEGCVNEGRATKFTCLPIVICGGCGGLILDVEPG